MEDYLKDYDNCVKYCGDDDDLEGCITAIRREKNDMSLCAKINKTDCEIINSDNFKTLIHFLIKFLQFLYCVRSRHLNNYDQLIITSISKINLVDFGLSLDDLSCVKFPGDDSLVPQFPHNFSEYISVMTRISDVVNSGEVLETSTKRDELLSRFEGFCSDYQPWSRTLSTFVNIHSQRLFGNSIPRIEHIAEYGSFISECDKNISKFNLLIKNRSTFDVELIIFLKIGTGAGDKYKPTRRKPTRRKPTRKPTKRKPSRKYKNPTRKVNKLTN